MRYSAHRQVGGKAATGCRTGVSSLTVSVRLPEPPLERANASQLLTLVRSYWWY
jgi:hypothetical protein